VLRDVVYDHHADAPIVVPELDIFLGKNYIVTHHDLPVAAVDRTWQSYQQGDRYLRQSASHLLYKLIDELTTDYLRIAEELDDMLDLIEDQLFDDSNPETLERIFILKRALLTMRRIILPQTEAINKLANNKYRVTDPKDRIFFRDVYDHFVRIQGLTENMREMVGIALNTYLTTVNNRMSDVMKTLTIFTALFMPLSFIVGFFGMNFFQAAAPLDDWTTLPAFILTTALILILPVGMYFWIRHRGWM
jgi:magnesium transporter